MLLQFTLYFILYFHIQTKQDSPLNQVYNACMFCNTYYSFHNKTFKGLSKLNTLDFKFFYSTEKSHLNKYSIYVQNIIMLLVARSIPFHPCIHCHSVLLPVQFYSNVYVKRDGVKKRR